MIYLTLALLYLIPFLSGAALSWVLFRYLQSRDAEREAERNAKPMRFQAELKYATLPVDSGKTIPIFYKRWDGALGRHVDEMVNLDRVSVRGSVGGAED